MAAATATAAWSPSILSAGFPKRLCFSVISSAADRPYTRRRRRDALGYNVVAARAHSATTVVVAAAASSAVPKSIISIVYRFFFLRYKPSARSRARLPPYRIPRVHRAYTTSVVLRPFWRGLPSPPSYRRVVVVVVVQQPTVGPAAVAAVGTTRTCRAITRAGIDEWTMVQYIYSYFDDPPPCLVYVTKMLFKI